MTSVALERFGRIVIPASDPGPRQFLRDTLLIPHGLRERWLLRCGRLQPDRLLETEIDGRGLPEGSNFRPVRAAIAAAADRDTTPAWIQIDDYEGTRGRSIVLLFASPHAERPFAAAKVNPASAATSFYRERVALQALSVSPVGATIPAARAYGEFEGAEVLLLTVLPGRSMDREMKFEFVPRAHVRGHFARARRWLTLFQHGRNRGAHGDFWARNILLSETATGVVDWEHYDADADPLDDVFHFALTYATAFRWEVRQRADAVERFRRGFGGRNVVAGEIRSWMAHFAQKQRLTQKEMQERMRLWLERGAAGKLERPMHAEDEWAAMLEVFDEEARCVFSG